MKKILALFIILIISINVNALAENDIVAIVNDQPITKYELQKRKELLARLQNMQFQTEQEEQKFADLILEKLVEEEILLQYAKKIGMEVSDKQLEEAIFTLEKRNNMPKGSMLIALQQIDLSPETYKDQIRAELLKNNIFGMIFNEVAVSAAEIDEVAISQNENNLKIDLWLFTTKDNSDQSYKKIQELKSALAKSDLSKITVNQFTNLASAEKITDIKKLSGASKAILQDSEIGTVSNIYQDNEKFKLLVVRDKEIITNKNELLQIKHGVNAQKASQRAALFLKGLKSQSNVIIRP